MFKTFFRLALLSLPLACFSMEDTEDLQQAVVEYLNYVNKISSGVAFPEKETADTILATDCKKYLNGQLYTSNKESFVNDLLSAYKNLGGWKVYPENIILAPASKNAVLRLFIQIKDQGTYAAIVILHFDSQLLITEIHEVLSPANGSYNFEGRESAAALSLNRD